MIYEVAEANKGLGKKTILSLGISAMYMCHIPVPLPSKGSLQSPKDRKSKKGFAEMHIMNVRLSK